MTITIIPAIDILGGKVVRLERGDYSKVTVYSGDPVKTAEKWFSKGAERLHVVDLDGAREGIMKNSGVIGKIARLGSIEVGGGIRSAEVVGELVSQGCIAVVGTKTLEPGFLESIEKYKESVLLAIDSRHNKLAAAGWLRSTTIDAYEFARKNQEHVSGIVFTAIERDGMMRGPDLKAIKTMVEAVEVDVIASGGISTRADIDKIEGLGAYGCIIGKALYEGKIKL